MRGQTFRPTVSQGLGIQYGWGVCNHAYSPYFGDSTTPRVYTVRPQQLFAQFVALGLDEAHMAWLRVRNYISAAHSLWTMAF